MGAASNLLTQGLFSRFQLSVKFESNEEPAGASWRRNGHQSDRTFECLRAWATDRLTRRRIQNQLAMVRMIVARFEVEHVKQKTRILVEGIISDSPQIPIIFDKVDD